ncbi:unnamed protein product [Aspergillus oryzae var. brunneus]|uniref:Unnamed protein product n=2 Tax=Aspergillus oryzae TaxID=5062 RepID=A0AAN4Y803_ASPOZ|nr:unnamed protein product [Aspergillus oryzae]GMG24479.1 unnamed protein product [Aspergillus oryzae]GMG43927.1 unnamed protein product [Aspergillus oryzae var. brunneus]
MKFDELILIDLTGLYEISSFIYLKSYPIYPWNCPYLPLAGGGPDVADVSITLGEAVQGVIALTAGTDETAKSVALVLAGVAAVLVNLADGDLDGGVVVGLDDAVGGAALAGHVAG